MRYASHVLDPVGSELDLTRAAIDEGWRQTAELLAEFRNTVTQIMAAFAGESLTPDDLVTGKDLLKSSGDDTVAPPEDSAIAEARLEKQLLRELGL